MKKSVWISAIIFSVLAIGFVAAQELPAEIFGRTVDINNMFEFIGSIFSPILTDTPTSFLSGDLFARLLLVILLFVILKVPAELITGEKDKDNKTLSIIVALIVSILAVRFLTEAMIQGILLPYSTLGIVVTAFIPFALLATFLMRLEYEWMRKIGWIMTAVVFTGLWWVRGIDNKIGHMADVYLIVTALSILLLLFDGTIQKWIMNIQLKKTGRGTILVQMGKHQSNIDQLYITLSTAPTGSTLAKQTKTAIAKEKATLQSLARQL